MSTAGTQAPVSPFSSLAEMRLEHNRLLKRHREVRNALGFLEEEVKGFLERGQATGELLGDDCERSAAQSLLDYWATVLYRTIEAEQPPSATLAAFRPELQPELPDDRCPYLGLDPFGEDHGRFFFGRQQLMRECLARLETVPLLAVVGGPGSGASSLARAGLLPALRQGARPGSEHWRYYATRVDPPDSPGAEFQLPIADPRSSGFPLNPFAMSGSALSGSQSPPLVNLRSPELQGDSACLTRALAGLGDGPALLVIDRFEEIFTQCSEPQQQSLASNLVAFLEAGNRVILVLRAGHERCVAELPSLQPFFERGRVEVPYFTTEELREAIEGPAKLVGLTFDAGLVDRLLMDLQGDPSALPLMQFTLLRLWQKRQRNRITWEAYKDVGGGRRALQLAAEDFYRRLNAEEQQAARRLLLRLIHPTLGPEVRLLRVRRDVLCPTTGGPESRVLDELVRIWLVRQTPNGEVMVSQEALAHHWPELRRWLDDARFDMRRRLRLAESARQWRDAGRDPSALRRGSLLEESRAYPDLNELEKEYLAASVAAEVAAANRERRLRYYQLAAVGTITVLVIAILGLLLWNARRSAETAREIADQQSEVARMNHEMSLKLEIANGRSLLEAGDVAGALLWFCEAQAEDDNKDRSEVHRLRVGAALRQLPKLVQFWNHDTVVNRVAFDPEGKLVVAALGKPGQGKGEARVWNVDTGKEVASLKLTGPDADDVVNHVAVTRTPDKRLLVATAGEARKEDRKRKAKSWARVWELRGSERLRVLDIPHDERINQIAFSKDGRRVVTAPGEPEGSEGNCQVWDIDRRQRLRILPHPGGANWVAFSPDGKRVVTAGGATNNKGGRALVWNLEREKASPSALDHHGVVNQALFSPDGRYLVTASGDQGDHFGEALVWDVEMARALRVLEHPAAVTSAAFSLDGLRVATASHDGIARVWRVRLWPGGDVRALLTLKHGTSVTRVAFSPDGRYLLTASRDQTARVWDATSGEPSLPPLNHQGTVSDARFSRDGHRIATANVNAVRVWEFTSKNLPPVILKDSDSVYRVSCTEDGSRLLTVDGPGAVERRCRLWDGNSGEVLATPWEEETVVAAALSPDGKLAVTASEGPDGKAGLARIWDVAMQKSIQNLQGSGLPQVNALAFSPDLRFVVAACGDVKGEPGEARVWEVKTGTLKHILRHDEAVLAASFSRDGSLVVTASVDDSAQVWDTAGGRRVGPPLRHNADVTYAAFSQDGEWVVTTSYDREARIWKVRGDDKPTIVLKHDAALRHANFSPNGRSLVTAAQDGRVRVWDVGTHQLITTLRHSGAVQLAFFDPDGQRVLTVSDHPLVQPDSPPPRRSPQPSRTYSFWQTQKQAWYVCPPPHEPESVRLYAELVGARKYRAATSELVPVEPAAELASHQQRLREQSFGDFLPWVEASHLRDAAECEATRQWAAAIWHLEQIGEVRENAVLLARRARAHASLRQWDKATADFTEAIKRSPKEASHYEGRAGAQVEQGKWSEAASDYTVAIDHRREKDQGLVREKRAAVYARLGRWREAIGDYTVAINQSKKSSQKAQLLDSRGQAYGALGQWDNAFDDYKKAIEVEDTLARHKNLAAAYGTKGEWVEAAAEYGRAIKHYRDDRLASDLYNRRAWAYAQQKPKSLWAKAATDLAKAIELRPDDQYAWRPLALAQLMGGNVEEYQKTCERMLERLGGSASTGIRNELAWVCVLGQNEAKTAEQAVQLAEQAVAASPRSYAYLNTLGAALYRAGHFKDAILRLDEARAVYTLPRRGSGDLPGMEADESTAPHGTVIDWLFLAMAYQREQNPTEAKKWLARATQSIELATAVRPSQATSLTPAWGQYETEVLLREARMLIKP